MTDISKCSGIKCPIKEKCYRYTAKTSMWQSYILEDPFKIEDGKFSCDMFWGELSESILSQLKGIIK